MIYIGSISKFVVISCLAELKEQMLTWIRNCQIVVTERIPEEKEENTVLLYVCSGPQQERILQEAAALQSLQQNGMKIAVLVEQDTPSYIKNALASHSIPMIENGGVSVETFLRHFQMDVSARPRANRVCVISPSGGMEKSVIAAYMSLSWDDAGQVQLVGWDPFAPSLARLLSIGEEKNKGLNALLTALDTQQLNGPFSDRLLARYTYQRGKVKVLPAQAEWMEAEKWDLPGMERVWELLEQQADVPVISELLFHPQAAPTWCALQRATDLILPFHAVSYDVNNAARFLEWLPLAGLSKLSIYPVAIGLRGLSKSKMEKILGMQISAMLPDYPFQYCERIETLPANIGEALDQVLEQIRAAHQISVQTGTGGYVHLSKTGQEVALCK